MFYNNLVFHWDIDPIIYNIGGNTPVGYYGVLFMLAMYSTYITVRWMYKREGLQIKSVDIGLLYTFAGVLIGARLAHCLFYDFNYYYNHISEIFLPFSYSTESGFKWIGFRGLASHGGIIGLICAIALYCKIHKDNFWRAADMVAVAAPLSFAIIRIGNLFNSEILGKVSYTSPFATIFERVDMLPRHPVQIYEAISYVLIFAVLLWLYLRKTKPATKIDIVETPDNFLSNPDKPLNNSTAEDSNENASRLLEQETDKVSTLYGSNKNTYCLLCFLSILLVSTARFIAEFYKDNQTAIENDMFLNMGQILCIPFIVVSGGMILMLSGRKIK